MKKTPVIVTGLAAVIVLGGGSSAFAMSNEIDVTAYGKQVTTRQLSGTVGDVLAGQGIDVRPTDLVTPSVDTPVGPDLDITVVQQRPVTLVLNGQASTELTPATTAGDYLAGKDLPENAQVSLADDTELGDAGTTIAVEVPKHITFVGQKGSAAFEVPERTVGEAAAAHLEDVQPTDAFYDASTNARLDPSSAVTEGSTVRIERVRTTDATATQDIAFTSSTTEDPELAAGTKKVTTEGVKGTKDVVTRTTTVDGVVTTQAVASETVTKEPVNEVVAKGTKKAAPTSAPAPTPSGSTDEDDAPASKQAPATAAAPKAAAPEAPKTEQSGSPQGDATTCKASFYGRGDGFDGGKTASGERFNAEAMTAAHKTLPLGTRIKVTNPSTGQSVVVKINDRGPYAGGRCLDLSAGAFDAIGDTGSGVMTVSYQVVG